MDYIVFDAAMQLFLKRASNAGCDIVPNGELAAVRACEADWQRHHDCITS